MRSKWLEVLSLLFLLLLTLTVSLQFEDVSNELLVGSFYGNFSVVAIGDQNGDKRNDLFLLSEDTLMVMTWDGKKKAFMKTHSLQTKLNGIESVSLYDFDGDGWLDTLISSTHFSPVVFWGNAQGPTGTGNVTISVPSPTHLIVIDGNGDHLPDVLVLLGGALNLWTSQGKNRSFNFSQSLKSPTPLVSVIGVYYVDINSDCLADVLVVQYSEGTPPFIDIWLRDPVSMNLTWSQSVSLPLPSSHTIYGKPGFADMNGDGQVDVIFISCPSLSCSHTLLHILYQEYNKQTNIIKCHPYQWNDGWKLKWGHSVTQYDMSWPLDPLFIKTHPPTIGDIDLDRFPDIILITLNSSSSSSNYTVSPVPHVFINKPCESNCHDSDTVIRSLEHDNSLFSSIRGVKGAILLDLLDNGIPDVLIVKEKETGGDEMMAMKQILSSDHMFVKTLVLSGYCFSDCSSGHEPLGSLLPGAVVSYETLDRNGHKVKATGSVSHSSSFLNSPSLPYILLGLGTTPNFIESLTIGLANNESDSSWYRSWPLLVPNSQLILIPSPISKPPKWKLQLYLTPSGLVYSVSGVLLAICFGLLIIIILLHAREKYQDSKERKQSKQRFYFNAM